MWPPSARNGAGLPELLNIFEKLMPNPTEGNPPLFYKGEMVDGQPVERLYREIRALRIYEGASEVQQLIIAREILRACRDAGAT